MNRGCVPVLAGAISLALMGPVASAQHVNGHASVMFDLLPDVEVRPAELLGPAGTRRQTVAELRTRLFAERQIDVGEHVRLTAAGFAEGLVGDRGQSGAARTAILRAQELHVEFLWSKADLRVGLSRVVWGRLDEFLPTDVVNPLDLTRFFLEGRVEGRLPVGMLRSRLLPSDRFTLEAIYVPVFRRGRFDQLEEDTSPFNLAPSVRRAYQEPRQTWNNGQGGVRASVTTG